MSEYPTCSRDFSHATAVTLDVAPGTLVRVLLDAEEKFCKPDGPAWCDLMDDMPGNVFRVVYVYGGKWVVVAHTPGYTWSFPPDALELA